MSEVFAGGLWCRQVLEHLDAFIDGSLDAGTTESAQEHLAACANCAAFGAAYGRVVAILRYNPKNPMSDEHLKRLRQRLGLS